MRQGTVRIRRLAQLLKGSVLAGFAAISIGCGQIEVPLDLGLVGDSTIGIELPFFSPPFDFVETSLSGGVETTLVVDLDPFQLITPDGLLALLSVDHIGIAGTEILIGGALPTGTICVTLNDDPLFPSGGMAFIQPFRSQIAFQLTLETLIKLTDPTLENLLGMPVDLPFGAEVDTSIPISLSDVFDLLFGLLLGGGGFGGGLELTQEIMTTLPPDTPLLGPAEVTAVLTLATVDEIPSDALTQECDAFLMNP